MNLEATSVEVFIKSHILLFTQNKQVYNREQKSSGLYSKRKEFFFG